MQILGVTRDLERHKGLDNTQTPRKLEVEYTRKIEEMAGSIAAMEAEKDAILRTLHNERASFNDSIARVVQAQTREVQGRLSALENLLGKGGDGPELVNRPRSSKGMTRDQARDRDYATVDLSSGTDRRPSRR